MKRIPCLVVSGFLGSGKTTLVRRLLGAAQAEGVRAAFISNEFGELGLDGALVGADAEAFVEIAGGCVCCALNDELYETLNALRAGTDPDRIVVETSGVAVPSDVQLTFYQPPVRDWVSEEAVVTVVNAEQLLHGQETAGIWREQVETADLVVLNKVDLVPADAIAGLRARLAAINPGVAVVAAEHCDIDLRVLFSGLSRDPADGAPRRHGQAHHHEHYESVELRLPAAADAARVRARLDDVDALRVKGFVQVDGAVHVVQGVGRRLEIAPFPEAVDPAVVGRVVVIRRKVPA